MREKPATPGRRPHSVAPHMNNFVSVFHASSLDPQKAQSQPQRPVSNSYCYIPGQYWQTLDYYDMAMDICTDFSDVRSIAKSASQAGSSLTKLIAQSNTSSVDVEQHPSEHRRRFITARLPLDLAPEILGSPGDSLRLIRTGSSVQESPSAEPDCPGHERCNSQLSPCEICQRDKKERRKEQNRKAQRNHRLRSEAKLEQLRAKVKSQAEEIVLLRDFNQSLLKHIDTLESKDKDGGTLDTGGQNDDADVLWQGALQSP